MHVTPSLTPRTTHVFFDAEGTLWEPRPGRRFADFWEDPTVENAAKVFRPMRGAHETLDRLRGLGIRLVVVSKHKPHLLPAILARFGLLHWFDDVLVTADKGTAIRDWLQERGHPPEAGLMVGDRPELDIAPVVAAGVPALLLDRPYNREAAGPRIADLCSLFPAIRPPGLEARPGKPDTPEPGPQEKTRVNQ